MRSSTRNQETTVNMSHTRSSDMSNSSQQHSYSESRHQLTRIPTRLPQNMDHSKKDRHKAKKEIKLSRGVATNTLPATRYKWPSEPQNRVQFVKADYLVRINILQSLFKVFESTSFSDNSRWTLASVFLLFLSVSSHLVLKVPLKYIEVQQ